MSASKMSEKDDVTVKFDQECSLGPTHLLQGVREVATDIIGCEGWTDIKIVNQMNADIHIHLIGGANREVREILFKDMTRCFSKKTYDGLKTTEYECEIWAANKHARLPVYGRKAPRLSNRFDIREEGIYLVQNRDEFLLYKWEMDEVDCRVNSPTQSQAHLLDSLNKLF